VIRRYELSDLEWETLVPYLPSVVNDCTRFTDVLAAIRVTRPTGGQPRNRPRPLVVFGSLAIGRS
jgi:hypothetical protein